MDRIINGTLLVSSFDPTGNPGEYTFTDAIFENQSDAVSAGATAIQVGFLVYAQALDPFSFFPVPGVAHRYVITSIQAISYTSISATILWDETGPEIDSPAPGGYAMVTENTSRLHLGLSTSQEVYANLPGGLSNAAQDADFRSIVDTLGITGPMGSQGTTGVQGVTGWVGSTGVQGVTGWVGQTGIAGITGIKGIDGSTGVQGVTGIGSNGQTGIQGVTGFGLQGATGIGGGGGTGIQYATQLPLGSLPGGFSPGIFPWDASTYSNPAFDEINALLLAIAPSPPGPLSGALTLTGTTKYAAIFPMNLNAGSWYQDGSSAGSLTYDYIVVPSYIMTTGNPSTTFKCGSTFTGDEGTVYHVLNGSDYSSRAILSGVGGTDIQITDISTYDSIWRKANARIVYTQPAEGYSRHSIRYQSPTVNQTSSDTRFWYDDVNAQPLFPSDATITQNTLYGPGRFLSGVQYYYYGDSFDMTSSITNIAKKGIHPSAPVNYQMPALSPVNLTISGATFPFDGTYNFAITDSLDIYNVYSIDARLQILATKPSGLNNSKTTPSQNRLVNTYSSTYSTNGNIYMYDEYYRWQLSNNFGLVPGSYLNPTGDWVSANLLISGNGQLYAGTWYYPRLNYTTGYLPSPQSANYSSFSGDQTIVWATNIGLSHSSMSINFTGIANVKTSITAEGTGSLNVSIRLPSISSGLFSDWADGGKDFQVGNGCRVNNLSSGSLLALTFGTNSSSDSTGVVFIRVILKNTSAALASRMVITGT